MACDSAAKPVPGEHASPTRWGEHQLRIMQAFLGTDLLDGYEDGHGHGLVIAQSGLDDDIASQLDFGSMGDQVGGLLKPEIAPAEAHSGEFMPEPYDVQGLSRRLLGPPGTSALEALPLGVSHQRMGPPPALEHAAGGAPSGAEGTRKRSSRYRGVTKHRRSGRYEAHVWVKDTGKQVYLGGFALEEHAAEAFDVACLKAKGHKAKLNFPLARYQELMPFLATVSMEALVMSIRRQSQGFARGSSAYRGVTHHPNGRWEARLGVPGSRHVYLGLFTEEMEAARAYDAALVRLRGPAAATNFSISDYESDLHDGA